MGSSRSRPLAADLWCFDGTVRMPGGALPTRMTVARLPSGSLWLHSPIGLDDALTKEVDSLGAVGHIVAPNCYHHLFYGAWRARYPAAKGYAAPGLESKRGDLTFDEELSDDSPPTWQGAILPLVIHGAPKMGEVVFVHVPSRSLIVSDLVFNIRDPSGFLMGLVLRMMGAHGRFAQSRLWGAMTKDKEAARRSVDRLLELDFDRIVPAHGEIVDRGGKDALREAIRRF